MKIREAMTPHCEFVDPDTSLQDAARKMRDLDVGFLALGRESEGRLRGVVTDRDIVLRGIAEGRSLTETKVSDVQTGKVLYCFEDDELITAAQSMRDQQVYRLIVLDNPQSKQLRGVISLGDIQRHGERQIAAEAANGISAKAA